MLGQQASSPVCLEHEKNENFHGEWTSVIFACPESVLPPPDHSTSFSLQQVTPSLLSFGATLVSWLQGLAIDRPDPFITVVGSGKAQ